MRAPVLTSAAEAWVAFVEERNFTRAAERLLITQPALHTKITKFQAEVGVELYRREGTTNTITPAGEALAELIRDLAERREGFLLGMVPSRPLALVAGPGTYAYLLGPAIRETLDRTDTHLSLTIKQGPQALDDVRRGRADLAVSAFGDVGRGLVADELARFSQVAIMPAQHPLARARSVKLEQLEELPLVLPPAGHAHRVTLDQAFLERGLRPEVAVEAEGWELMISFVLMGVGCAVVHSYVPQREGLALVPVCDLADVRYQVVTKRETANDRDIVRFVDSVKATLRR